MHRVVPFIIFVNMLYIHCRGGILRQVQTYADNDRIVNVIVRRENIKFNSCVLYIVLKTLFHCYLTAFDVDGWGVVPIVFRF